VQGLRTSLSVLLYTILQYRLYTRPHNKSIYITFYLDDSLFINRYRRRARARLAQHQLTALAQALLVDQR